jgi:predicted nuclease of predicted toxin-antitoxin system
VRILLDQNLSPKLIRKLVDVLPGLESVYEHDLIGASDLFIFEWARRSAFSAVVSADRDFVLLAERLGTPPKIIRIDRCEYSSAVLEQLLRRESIRIQAFLGSDRAVLILNTAARRVLP